MEITSSGEEEMGTGMPFLTSLSVFFYQISFLNTDVRICSIFICASLPLLSFLEVFLFI